MEFQATEEKKFLGQFITDEMIDSWQNRITYICAGTNAGKTTLCLENLYDYYKAKNQKILILSSRKPLKQQTTKKAKGKRDYLGILTYQKLEDMAQDGNINQFLNQFEAIICDEFQYFYEDAQAQLNQNTELSLDAIIFSHKTLFLLSATGDNMADYIEYTYDVGIDKVEFHGMERSIPRLYYYDSAEGLDQIVNLAIIEKSKTLVFVNQIDTAIRLVERYPDDVAIYFSLSPQNKRKYKKYVDKAEYKSIVDNEIFSKTVYVATIALDVGVSIQDPDLHNIVIDGVADIDRIIQCVGRKRLEHDKEKIYLYMRNIENATINAYATHEQAKINLATELIQNGRAAYIQKRDRRRHKPDPEGLIFDLPTDEKKHVNHLMLYKCKCMVANYRRMLRIKKIGYLQTVIDTFKIQELIYWNLNDDNDLFQYLDYLAIAENPKTQKENNNKWLLDDEAKERFKKHLGLGRGYHLIDKPEIEYINAYIRIQKKFPFKLEKRETSRRIDGKKIKYKNAWRVVKCPVEKR